MSDFDERLTQELRDRATLIDLPDPGPERIMRRGERRRRRARTLAVVSTVAVVGGAVVAVRSVDSGRGRHGTKVVVSGDPDGSSLPDLGASTPGGASRLGDVPAANVVASSREWKTAAVPFGKGLGWIPDGGGVQRAGNTLLAVSTLPGVNTDDSKRALYRSTDGVNWSSNPIDQSHWFAGLGARGDTLIGVGTASATSTDAAQRSHAVVSRSTDGGRTWDDVKLPLDVRSLESKLPDGVGLDTQTSLASGPNQTLVAMRTMLYGDVRKLLPAGVDARWGMRVGTDGIEVMAKPDDEFTAQVAECVSGVTVPSATCIASLDRANIDGTLNLRRDLKVARVVSWAELGYTPDEAALAGGALNMFATVDGASFTVAASPTIGLLQPPVHLVAVGEGFALGGYEADPAGDAGHYAVYRTDDLATWTPSEPLALNAGVQNPLVAVGDRVAVIGQGDRGGIVVALSNGTTWQLSDLSAGLATRVGVDASTISMPQIVASGPGGVAIVANLIVNPMSGVDVTMHDHGYTLRAQGATSAVTVAEDATGKVVARASDLFNLADHTSALKLLNADGTESQSMVATTVSGVFRTVPLGPSTASGVAPALATPITTLPSETNTAFTTLPPPITAIATDANVSGTTVPVAATAPVGTPDTAPTCPAVRLSSSVPCVVPTFEPLGSSAVLQAPDAPATAVLVDPNGKELARFALAELHRAVQEAINKPARMSAHNQFLVHSRDGVSWTADELVAVSGDRLTYVTSLVVTADQVIATGSTQTPDPSAPKRNAAPILEQIALTAAL